MGDVAGVVDVLVDNRAVDGGRRCVLGEGGGEVIPVSRKSVTQQTLIAEGGVALIAGE